MKNVKYFMFKSGQEFIAEVVDVSNSEFFTVKNPVSIMIQNTPGGRVNVAMYPFPSPMVKEDTFTFEISDFILANLNVVEELEREYNNQFSKIYTPEKSESPISLFEG